MGEEETAAQQPSDDAQQADQTAQQDQNQSATGEPGQDDDKDGVKFGE
jgi:hypothetical protein